MRRIEVEIRIGELTSAWDAKRATMAECVFVQGCDNLTGDLVSIERELADLRYWLWKLDFKR